MSVLRVATKGLLTALLCAGVAIIVMFAMPNAIPFAAPTTAASQPIEPPGYPGGFVQATDPLTGQRFFCTLLSASYAMRRLVCTAGPKSPCRAQITITLQYGHGRWQATQVNSVVGPNCPAATGASIGVASKRAVETRQDVWGGPPTSSSTARAVAGRTRGTAPSLVPTAPTYALAPALPAPNYAMVPVASDAIYVKASSEPAGTRSHEGGGLTNRWAVVNLNVVVPATGVTRHIRIHAGDGYSKDFWIADSSPRTFPITYAYPNAYDSKLDTGGQGPVLQTYFLWVESIADDGTEDGLSGVMFEYAGQPAPPAGPARTECDGVEGGDSSTACP